MRNLSLTLATAGTGLVTGLFGAFSVAVMPGLRAADDRTFVEAMQRINVAIVNPVFLLLFLGSPALLAVASATDRRTPVFVATGLTGAALLVSFAVNIPLNDRLAAAGLAHPAAARDAFEHAWNVGHLVRTALMTGSFAACLVALRSA